MLFGAEARHLLTAVVMTAPGTILISKMLVPELGTPKTAGKIEMAAGQKSANILDATARGVTDGLYLALNVAAMLIAFIALVYLANGIWATRTARGPISGPAHPHSQSCAYQSPDLVGVAAGAGGLGFGVPWRDARAVGNLLGTKLVFNEFVAFPMLGPLKGHIAERSFTIATYALCGFANFSSIGIQIGGIGALAPSRKQDLADWVFAPFLRERWRTIWPRPWRGFCCKSEIRN